MLPALSGRERATLVLRDYKARKPQDPRLGRDMNGTDLRDYNRLIRLMNACNLQALIVILLLVNRVDKASLKLGWLVTAELGRGRSKKPAAILDHIAFGLAEALVRDVEGTWAELAAINAALAKVAEEFGGEDPVRPDTRQEIDDALAELKELRDQLAFIGHECDLPATDPEEAEQCLEFIRHFASP
jgi:hypothetical protein